MAQRLWTFSLNYFSKNFKKLRSNTHQWVLTHLLFTIWNAFKFKFQILTINIFKISYFLPMLHSQDLTQIFESKEEEKIIASNSLSRNLMNNRDKLIFLRVCIIYSDSKRQIFAINTSRGEFCNPICIKCRFFFLNLLGIPVFKEPP